MAESLAAYEARIDAESAEHDAFEAWCLERDLVPADDHWASFRAEMADAYDTHRESRAEARHEDRFGY